MEPEARGAAREELDKVLDHVGGGMGAPREYFASRFDTCPPATTESSRIVMVDGRVVSHIRVYRRDLRLRGGVIASGHLSEVSTHPDFRRRGFGRALLKDSARYIASQGWPLACVWSGVTQFYSCEDWVRFPLIATSLYTPLWTLTPPPDVRVRRYRRGQDDPAVAEIYEEYNRKRNLCAVRDAEYWRLHYSWIRGEEEDGFLIAEKQGLPVGYCRAAHAKMTEYGVRDGHDNAGVALVDALIRRDRKQKADRLAMLLPADETLITAQPQLRYDLSLTESLMLRVIDLKALLDVALETSPARLRGIDLTETRVISIEVLDQKCALRLQDGRATAEALPATARATPLAQTEFFKLIFGATIEKDLSAFARGDRHLLNDLFPPDGPVYWRADVL